MKLPSVWGLWELDSAFTTPPPPPLQARHDAVSAAFTHIVNPSLPLLSPPHQARHDAFSAAFAHIAASINDIYQELTRSTVHKLGEWEGGWMSGCASGGG